MWSICLALKKIKQSRKLNSYTSAYKLEAIKHAKLVSIHSASTKFHVYRKRIRDWIKSEKKLHLLNHVIFNIFTLFCPASLFSESSPAGKIKKRLQGGGRPLKYKDLDNELSIWVRERRLKKLRVSRRLIQQQAERTFNGDQDDGDFKASEGWLNKFIARHNFCLRVQTTVCQKPPREDAQKLVDFIMYVSRLRQQTRYSQIYAADETPVWMDPSAGKCIDEKGAKEVSVMTTGHDKARVTVMLTARSDGFKCKPYVLLPRKRPDPKIVEKYKTMLLLCWEGKSWMDENGYISDDSLELDWSDELIAPNPEFHSF